MLNILLKTVTGGELKDLSSTVQDMHLVGPIHIKLLLNLILVSNTFLHERLTLTCEDGLIYYHGTR